MIGALREIGRWPAAAREHWRSLPARRTRLWLIGRFVPPVPTLLVWAAAFVVALLAWGPGSYNATLVLAVLVAFLLWLVPPLPRTLLLPVAVIALAVTYPLYFEHLFQVPVFESFPNLDTAVSMLVFMTMAIGLNIVVGYAGLLDLGYVAFYAMGAYTAAWLASAHFNVDFSFGAVGVTPGLGGIHIAIWLVLLAAGCLTALVGVIIGLPTLRLRGDYLAIVTLGFGEILPQIARNGDNLGGFNLTNGAQGINPIDSAGFGSLGTHIGLPNAYITDTFADRWHYWTLLVILVLTVVASLHLRDSRLGRAWIAIREDEVAAAAMGIPLMRTKTWAYAAGAFFGGIAGAYYATYKNAVFPDDFKLEFSIFVLSMVILGGMGNVWGVIVGGGFLAFLNYAGLSQIGDWLNLKFSQERSGHLVGLLHHDIQLPQYAGGIFGLILVVTMLFRPEGLLPSERRKAEFHEGVHDEPLRDVQQ
ncbi:MAG: branched-chain amino acid transport system permease protein [Gaiellaceae bacterium]|nr:branched-chain amino acid transport system permease protein [Gaiellaceae bacterium]